VTRLTSIRVLFFAVMLLMTCEAEYSSASVRDGTPKDSKPNQIKSYLPPPDFSSLQVKTISNPRVPPGDVQLNISWDGLDQNLNPYPFQASAEIYIDSIPSGYRVSARSSTNIYVPSVVHAVTLLITNGNQSSPPSRTVHSAFTVPRIMKTHLPPPIAPELFPTITDPHLDCSGSGEVSGDHPGWSSATASQLTVVTVDPQNYGIYWCPASAPYGDGFISYTVTATPDAITCETTNTYCLMPNTIDGKYFTIMATDRTGSYDSNVSIVPNSGLIQSCTNAINSCNIDAVFENYPTFGNLAPELLGDCTFAAVADWEEAYLGLTQSPAQIEAEFSDALGKTEKELSNEELFAYWKRSGIGDTFLQQATSLSLDPFTVESALDTPITRDLIAQLQLTAGDNFAGYQIAQSGYHWVVVDGYTPKGPIIITWGQILQMTWQQWNYDAQNLWSIATK